MYNTIRYLLAESLNIYRYGSYVYGTYEPGVSDADFIVILPYTDAAWDGKQLEYGDCQYTFYTTDTWQRMLEDHDVGAIETMLLRRLNIVKETMPFDVTINNAKLRESFSRVASNSWVKCKKKLTVEKDYAPRIAKKSLWHSLRILDFGIQIAKFGTIADVQSLNGIYHEIVDCECNNYSYYKRKYQAQYNALKSEFRQVAPK